MITGTSSRPLAQGAILRGSLITKGGQGDWIELPPGTISDPAPIVCVAGVAVCYIKGHPPLVIPPPGGRKTPLPPGGPSGDETFCMELEANLNIKDVEIKEQLEDLGCPLPGTSGP